MTQRDTPTPNNTERGMRAGERSLAAILGMGAVALGAIGLLRGFAWFTEGTVANAPLTADFGAGMMWMLPAIALAVLAAAVATSNHRHDTGAAEIGPHLAAYLSAAGTIGLGAIGLLTGFNWLGMGTGAVEGLLWGSAAIGAAFVTWGFHAAVPAAVPDEDYLVRLVESRVANRSTGQTRAEPAPATESKQHGS